MEFFSLINRKTQIISNALSIILKFVLIITIINSLYYSLWHIASISILLLFLLFIPQFLKKSHKINLPKEFEFLMLIFIIFVLFSKELGLFVTPILFGIATGFTGLLITLILYSDNKIKKAPLFIALFAFCLSLSISLVIELSKYLLKIILNHEINSGMYVFTMNLMSFVAIGSFTACLIGFLYMKGKLNILNKIIKIFEKSNPNIALRKKTSKKEIDSLIKKGENKELEFKSTLRKNLHTGEKDKKIEQSVLKTISAFMNTSGGILLIGVSDNGEINGIEKDEFENKDKFTLHLTNLIKEKIGKRFMHLIDYSIIETKGKAIIKINCAKSNKPVFLKEDESEGFYIRIGPASVKLEGSDLLNYVNRKFE